MNTEVFGLIYTEKCNFRCRHCCNESGPAGAPPMGIEELRDHIRLAASCGRFEEIGVSGGEPFLFPHVILDIVKTAQQYGMTSSITTNAFWGLSEMRAREALTPLVDAGLAALNISISRFHLEFTNGRRVKTAAAVSWSLGLVTRVNVVETADFTVEDARGIFGELGAHLYFVPVPCIPAGRAVGEVARGDLSYQGGQRFGNCRKHFSKVAVTATGDVYPCCSPGGFTPPLLGGSIRDEEIGDIIRRMEQSMLIQVLEGVGPSFFVPFIKERVDHRFSTDEFVDQCHLCHTIMSRSETREAVRSALEELESELSKLDITLSELQIF